MPNYVIDEPTIQKLRQFWKNAMSEQREQGGIFSYEVSSKKQKTSQQNTQSVTTIYLHIDEQQEAIKGRLVGKGQDGYTLCEVHDDAPYTFHMHPIEEDPDTGLCQNIPNLISNEDMIGVVQDSAFNTGYLSNPSGQLIFDILCAPVGIFVYCAEEKIIEKWIELEDEIDETNVESMMKMFDKRFSLQKSLEKGSTVEEVIQLAKNKIQYTHNNKNEFWASEENALMNNGFNKYIGSWYYANQNLGLFSSIFVKQFSTLGYQFETLQLDFSNSTCKQQIEWFESEHFLNLNWNTSTTMQHYIFEMKQIGFDVKFFNWNSKIIQFTLDTCELFY